MAITRRQFLRKSAITAMGLSFASPLLDNVSWAASRRDAGTRLAASGKTLVVLNLYGGNDGMNTVIPVAQYDRYSAIRPTLAVARDRILTLNGRPDVGLSPGMLQMQSLYNQGKVGVICGVGAPQEAVGLFDHEASQYLFQSADVLGTEFSISPSGWVGRWLDSVNEGIVSPGVNFGGGQLMMTGLEREALTIGSLDQFTVELRFDADARFAAYRDILSTPNESGVGERNRSLRLRAIEQSEIVRDRTANYVPAVQYPEDSYLADSLRQCAQLIDADLGVRALAVGFDGYDTHAGQNDGQNGSELGYHEFLMYTVSEAVGAFQADVTAHGHAEDVVLVVISEFGRRPEENNDAGTDHGYASVGFVVGETVRGGVYGDYPSLDPDHLVLDGNLDVTTDFRSIYATILANYLGTDPGPVLRGDFPTLGFL